MKIFNRLIIIIILLIAMACESDNIKLTEFTGIVLSYDNREPIGDVSVTINRHDGIIINYDGVSYNGIWTDTGNITNTIPTILDFSYLNPIIDTVKTDNNGRYYLRKLLKDRTYYNLDIVSDNYVILFGLFDRILQQDYENEDTVIIGESTYLKLNLVNNSENYNDSIYVEIDGKTIPYRDLLIGPTTKVLKLYPQINDTTITYKLSYDMYKTTTIKWSISNDLDSSEENQEINLIPIDTTVFTIEF